LLIYPCKTINIKTRSLIYSLHQPDLYN